ncbi:MAG: coproporphyrinogen III oxidase family protein [Bacteriovoracaceae bacterium]|nr:coproporphyrinogen III oxidase family protein [Bacteriovoracaceae bacterium]
MKNTSLYIHYPFCKKLCNYCDFYKKPLSLNQSYTELEEGFKVHLEDLNELREKVNAGPFKSFETIYLGGGTPSLWDVEGANFLDHFFSNNHIIKTDDCEFTMEVDPGAWTERGLNAWESIGVNRYSVGLQSLNEDFIKIMDRSHDLGESLKTLKYLKESNKNYSVDFMLGLPHSHEKKRDIEQELKRALDFNPTHLSVYILKTRKNYPHNDELPDDDFVRDEYLKVSEFLRKSGFDHYEVSNYSLPGKESRHNFKYWQAETVHALGPNATGFLRTEDGKAIRYQHRSSNTGMSTEELDAEALKLEEVYLNLRTNRGIDLNRYFSRKRAEILKITQKWKKSGYVESLNGLQLVLNSEGYLMIDSLMDDLFQKDLL